MSRRRYVRRLSPMERYWLVVHQIHRYQVDGIVEGVGEIDPLALRAAVAKAAEANAGVRVRLKGFLIFSKWVDSGVAPEVQVIDDSDWDGTSERNAEFMSQGFDPLRGGAVADVFLVRCKDGMTRLVFRTLHAAIDGRGLIHWICEVFRALRGEALQGSRSTVLDMQVQERHQDRVVPAAPASPQLCIPVIEPGPAAPLRYIWRRAIIDRAVSNMLPKTAAFLAQWARRRNPGGEVAFTVPVDYRGLRTDEMSIGNLTGYLPLNVGVHDTPRTLMQQLVQSIRDYADCRIVPRIRIVPWLPIRYMVRKLLQRLDTMLYTVNQELPSGGIVSMGGLQMEWGSCPGFQARALYGIPGAAGKLNVIFMSTPAHTVVSFSAPAAYNHQGQLDELVGAYRDFFSRKQDSGGIGNVIGTNR